MKPFFSIITCTFNPDSKMLLRVISSVLNQETNSEYEFLIIDNNSTNDFLNNSIIKKKIESSSKIRIIKEDKQGLVYARISGVTNSNGEVIVFVDDDNELNRNYLEGVRKLISEFPKVKAWGAGRINVDLFEGAESWVKKYMMSFYQQRDFSKTQFGNSAEWLDYYPVGSGLTIFKDSFRDYNVSFNTGQITSTGRKGDSLASGEDSQIIWTIIKNNEFVGSSPLLQLTHIIPRKRTTLEYLRKLNFNLSLSFFTSYKEIFNSDFKSLKKPNYKTFLGLFLKSLKSTHFNISDSLKIFQLNKMWYLGYIKYLESDKHNLTIK